MYHMYRICVMFNGTVRSRKKHYTHLSSSERAKQPSVTYCLMETRVSVQ